jgi:ribosome maturation protein Sdo1
MLDEIYKSPKKPLSAAKEKDISDTLNTGNACDVPQDILEQLRAAFGAQKRLEESERVKERIRSMRERSMAALTEGTLS